MLTPLLLLLGLLVWLPGCAVDPRTGRDAANALANGPVRHFAQRQAADLAAASQDLARAVAPWSGEAVDLPAGQVAWEAARAAFDQGAPVFLTLAPEIGQELDGRADNPIAWGGLRQVEGVLFVTPPAPPDLLRERALRLADAAARLPGVVADRRRVIDIADLLAGLSGLAAVTATKADGSDSPYAGLSHRSIGADLQGQAAIYHELAPLVAAADPALHERIERDLRELRGQVQGLSSVDQLADKVRFLQGCADLSQGFLDIAGVLGLRASAPIDVT